MMGLISDDFDDLLVGDLFHPAHDNIYQNFNDAPALEQPYGVANELTVDMENYQQIFPSVSLSADAWIPDQSESQPVYVKIHDPTEEEHPLQSVNPGVELEDVSFTALTRQQTSPGPNSEAPGDGLLLLPCYHPSLPFTLDAFQSAEVAASAASGRTTSGTEMKASKMGKTKIKENVTKSDSKKTSRLVGSVELHLANGPATIPFSSSKEEERRMRRKESNRRAAEKYRTKLKSSAIDVATDHKRLAEENARLKAEVDLYRRHMTELYDVIARHRQHCSLPIQLPQFCASVLQEVGLGGQSHGGFTDSPLGLPQDGLSHTELDNIFSAPSSSDGISSTGPGKHRIYACNVNPLLGNSLALDILCQNDASSTVIAPQPSHGGTQYLTGTAGSTTAVPVNSFGQLQVLSLYVKAENEQPLHIQIGN